MIWEIDDGEREIEGLDAHGRPDPGYAQSLGLIPAPYGRRAMATILEILIAGAILLPALIIAVPRIVGILQDDPAGLLLGGDLLWILIGWGISQLLMTAFVLVQLILHGRRGVTIGKAVFGLRTVNVKTLERPRFWRGAVVRYLIGWASFVIPVIGPLLVVALSPFFDVERRGRGWVDLAAQTWIVDIRKGLNPYDAKRMRIARKSLTMPEHEEKPPLPSLATPVDQHVPEAYVPSARFSGGVIGVHRAVDSRANGPAAPAPSPAPAPAPTPAPAFASPAQQPAPTAVPASGIRAVLELDDGRRIEVGRVTLVGRGPAAGPGEEGAELIRIDDDTRSVSKTHLALLPARRGVHVMDRGSTNGSALQRGGAETPLVPGQSVEIAAGDVIRFGDRWMRVTSV